MANNLLISEELQNYSDAGWLNMTNVSINL